MGQTPTKKKRGSVQHMMNYSVRFKDQQNNRSKRYEEHKRGLTTVDLNQVENQYKMV